MMKAMNCAKYDTLEHMGSSAEGEKRSREDEVLKLTDPSVSAHSLLNPGDFYGKRHISLTLDCSSYSQSVRKLMLYKLMLNMPSSK